MILGTAFICMAWLVSDIPLWFRIALTIFFSLRILAHFLMFFAAVDDAKEY